MQEVKGPYVYGKVAVQMLIFSASEGVADCFLILLGKPFFGSRQSLVRFEEGENCVFF